jgi:hypothetical protein
VLGQIGLAGPNPLGQLTNVLFAIQQRTDDVQPGGRREQSEQLGRQLEDPIAVGSTGITHKIRLAVCLTI